VKRALAFITQQQVIQCLMVAVVVSVCLAELTLLHPLLQWRPLALIGVISYGVYLLHMLSANVVRAVMHQTYGVLVFAATLATVIALAYLSFRYFETPLLKLKRRFETKDQRKGDELTRITAR
jgi:peptidoglycan/LPS O-acetylase OafA/YrhL